MHAALGGVGGGIGASGGAQWTQVDAGGQPLLLLALGMHSMYALPWDGVDGRLEALAEAGCVRGSIGLAWSLLVSTLLSHHVATVL